MNTNINLVLRTDEGALIRKKRIKALNFAAVVSLIGVGLISLSLFIMIKSVNLAGIKQAQENILKKMFQLQSRQIKLFVLNNRVENINKVLGIRKDMSKTTNGLLVKIPSDLAISSFEVDDKSVIIAGQSKSLSVIGEFIDNLTDMVRKKEIIKSLTLSSLSLDANQGVYQVSIRSEL